MYVYNEPNKLKTRELWHSKLSTQLPNVVKSVRPALLVIFKLCCAFDGALFVVVIIFIKFLECVIPWNRIVRLFFICLVFFLSWAWRSGLVSNESIDQFLSLFMASSVRNNYNIFLLTASADPHAKLILAPVSVVFCQSQFYLVIHDQHFQQFQYYLTMLSLHTLYWLARAPGQKTYRSVICGNTCFRVAFFRV